MFQNLSATVQSLIQPQAKPAQPTVTPSSQQAIDTQSMGGYDPTNDPLFHHADKPSVTGPAMTRLQTKKTHEKIIGAKFNMNDEVNQIQQQANLNDIGLNLLRAMYSRQYNGEKPPW